MKPRIGIHCPGTGAGGPWRYVHSLLSHIDLQEYDVSIICDIDGRYEQRPEINVIPLKTVTHTVSAPSTQPLPALRRQRRILPQDVSVVAGFLRSAGRLARVFKPHRFDLLHTQCTGCEEAPVAAHLAGISHVVGTFHTDSTYDLHDERSSIGYQFLERISNRCLHRAIAVSAATGYNWRRRTYIPSNRIINIHNGIDACRFARQQPIAVAREKLNLPADAFIVAGLGRLDEAKGFSDLIAAVQPLSNVVIVIAGDGPMKESLIAQVSLNGVRLRLLGFLNDVQPLLDAADLFALPSLCEACPYAVLEALAAGVPVLASDVGGVAELICGAGILLPSRNPAIWTQAIQYLQNNDEERIRLSNLGRERVRQFTERDMVSQTFQVYRDLLKWD